MKWRKEGLIFCPDNNFDWMISHASTPFVEPLENDLYRIYFSCRDTLQRSSIGFFEINISNPSAVLRLGQQPVMAPGRVGLYDDSGASMGCLIRHDGKKYLYYIGWNLAKTVPWRNFIGLAISQDDELNFVKYSTVPIIDRSEIDPFSISYPWIIKDGSVWKMWYGSNLDWGMKESDMQHVIKYAESTDGVHWDRSGLICVSFNSPEELAIARPCVIKSGNFYRMWYSYRGEKYRLGYAESTDGIEWKRKDKDVGISVSSSGWDSEMIEYSCVFERNSKLYMLYNGNQYGKTGIGMAILEE